MSQGSDSADMDRMVELFYVLRGIDLDETLRRMVPPAWRDDPALADDVTTFFETNCRAHGTMAAWEGPMAIVATEGKRLIGLLDKMGLRPLRYVVTTDGLVCLSSEMGAVPISPDRIARTGQLNPGEMLVADTQKGTLTTSSETDRAVVAKTRFRIEDLRALTSYCSSTDAMPEDDPLDPALLARFGWNRRRLRFARSMVKTGEEPVISMGHDKPLAIFSEDHPTLFKYFKQIVAVVTNPPIDPIREGGAMELRVHLGKIPRITDTLGYEIFPQYELDSPIMTRAELDEVLKGGKNRPYVAWLDMTFKDTGNWRDLSAGIEAVVEEGIRQATEGEDGHKRTILVFSDRKTFYNGRLPLPSLLVASHTNQRLSEEGIGRDVSIVVDTGEIQEPHDAAVLIACGATAVCPYLLYRLAYQKRDEPGIAAMKQAMTSGLKKIMSKVGITAIDGYRGCRQFEAVGISPEIIDMYLPGITSLLGGIDFEDMYRDVVARSQRTELQREKPVRGFRKKIVESIHQVAQSGNRTVYQEYMRKVEKTVPIYLRDLLTLNMPKQGILVDEVEGEAEIIAKAIRGAAVSHGAISREAHMAIAQAFNHFNSRSNCGEGGEDRRRNPGGPWEDSRSRIRQVASGRFGVDAFYMVHADELQIKIGQGAKPGEGGHLPGKKVTTEIAAIRHTQPGVSLISPPPHHDIYSIEDFAQLVYSLRQINPAADTSVKIPAVTDIGTIAVGIAKAGVDIIKISGFDGGAGAAPTSSIEHAGLPVIRGVTETHHALKLNGLRNWVSLRVDGGLKTGLDVVKLLLLGADEVAFGSVLMVAQGCVMCRRCNIGKCPAGIASQLSEVRKRHMAKWCKKSATRKERIAAARDAIISFLFAVARDIRETMAALGVQRVEELVGRTDYLRQIGTGNDRHDKADLSRCLAPVSTDFVAVRPRELSRTGSLNRHLVTKVRKTIAGSRPIVLSIEASNSDRSIGATLFGYLARIYNEEFHRNEGYKPRRITININGNAGQGLGFGSVDGMTIRLSGYANDMVGEAMGAGSTIIVTPPHPLKEGHSLVGNAAAYGATGGRLYVAGLAGQRLGVRNSGTTIVTEGTGKYAFEYNTGGTGVILGPVGPVIGSGMTGGEVFVYDPEKTASQYVHSDVVTIPMDEESYERLKTTIEDFAAETGSLRGEAILKKWEQSHSDFIRIVPRAFP
ncbi:MAG: IMP dehydrogenase [Desulfobacterales bacterium]|nr:IMP dehydrogenase [Desulfobacterales bacterium]